MRATGGVWTTVSTTSVSWTSETIPVAGVAMQVSRAGSGPPLLILHHDIGTLDRLPFYDALARRFTVLVPTLAGYDGSQRPEWMRHVRVAAAMQQWLLSEIAGTRTTGGESGEGVGIGG